MATAQITPEAYLEALLGSERRRFPLTADAACQIGRGEPNTIVLTDTQVSRRHAVVQAVEGGGYSIIDLGSRNGTFVNQRRVAAPVLLQPGDRVTIGSHELVFQGATAAPPAPAPSASETVVDIDQRTITVLVADIRDFTGLSSRLGEARLSEIISAFMREAGAVLHNHGSWGQKYIGDAVMAIWVHADDAPKPAELRGVFRALDALFEIAAGLQSRFTLDAPIRIGAGINTGLAAVGNMGSDAASDYTALSEAVNIAFRLESATKDLRCDLALGKRTYEVLAALDGTAESFRARTANLKGYRDPKPAYAADRVSLRRFLDRAFA